MPSSPAMEAATAVKATTVETAAEMAHRCAIERGGMTKPMVLPRMMHYKAGLATPIATTPIGRIT